MRAYGLCPNPRTVTFLNPYQESSSFHIPQGTLSMANALPTLLLGQGPAALEELLLSHGILSNLSSLLKPPFIHSLSKSDVKCSCAKQCAVACHTSQFANLFNPQTSLLR